MKKYKSLILFLFAALIFLFVFFFLVNLILKNHTNHNQLIEVPNLLGKSVQESHNELINLKLNYDLLDIGAYNPNYKIGSVVNQDPLPYDKVKEGRKIYLTINPDKIPYTIFPDILDKPFRYAVALLYSYKLKVGDIYYKNDIAAKVILKSKFEGFTIKKSDSLPIFSLIDLYVGSGIPLNQFEFKVPQLIGLSIADAEINLKESFLNLGDVYIDDVVLDSLALFVYKQSKRPLSTTRIYKFNSQAKAPSVDIWVTNDSSKLIY